MMRVFMWACWAFAALFGVLAAWAALDGAWSPALRIGMSGVTCGLAGYLVRLCIAMNRQTEELRRLRGLK